MIKFFRKIRQNLLNQGKTTKYFKYAIGEIILVVIGILIALQINNWNTNKANEKQAYNQLLEVQKEIVYNITEFDARSDYYIKKLRNVRRVFTDTLTLEDYQNDRSLSSIISAWQIPETQNEAFYKLVQNADNLPEKYKTLVLELKKFYNFSKIELAFPRLINSKDEYVLSTLDFSEILYYGDRDPYYQFLLTSKDYKNRLASYSFALDDLVPHFTTKKYDGITLYKRMLALGFPSDEIDKIATMYIDSSPKLAEPFIGRYTNTKDTLSISLINDEMLLTVEANGLKFPIIMSDSLKLYVGGKYLEFNNDTSKFYDLTQSARPNFKRIPTND
jgi:hypothetical protein